MTWLMRAAGSVAILAIAGPLCAQFYPTVMPMNPAPPVPMSFGPAAPGPAAPAPMPMGPAAAPGGAFAPPPLDASQPATPAPARPMSPAPAPAGDVVGPVLPPEGTPIAATQILAVIGDQAVLAGELLPMINAQLKQFEDRVPKEELEKQRRLALQNLLPTMVEQKLLYLDFLRTAPHDKLKDIHGKINERFDEIKLEPTMKKFEANSLVELEEKLRSIGSSLDKERRKFAEQMLSQEMVRRNVKYEFEVTFDEMFKHYEEHRTEYEFPEQVKWESLSVSFSRVPAKPEAWRAMAQMGNRVLRGAPLAEVAKSDSQGPDAIDGGQHGWTKRGELASKTVEDAIFTLPENQLSPILEDEQGFYILRVTARKAAGLVPFEEAQVGIKEKIKKERIRKQISTYLDKLKTQTRVWSAFDATGGGAASTARRPDGAQQR